MAVNPPRELATRSTAAPKSWAIESPPTHRRSGAAAVGCRSGAVVVGPAGRPTVVTRNVQIRRLAVQRNGLEQQLVVAGALNCDGEMVPGAAERVTSYPGVNPLLVDIVPGVPLVTASDTALVTPDPAFVIEELVKVELQSL